MRQQGVREPVRRADSQYTFRGKDALGVESAGIVEKQTASGPVYGGIHAKWRG